MPSRSAERLLTPPALAARWAVSPSKVLALIRSGELRAINLAANQSGRPRYKISPEDVEAFEKSRQVVPPLRRPPMPPQRPKPAGNVRKYF